MIHPAIEYRKLGKWGVRVSSISLGSYLTIGHHVAEDVNRQIIRRAYDVGVNFFDTANAYNKGEAEKALGQLLAPFRRDSYVLATKVFAPMGPGPNDKGLSRKHIFEQCHASLVRLATDYIDLYQCHRYDPDTPLEETLRALDDLVRQGKVLYWGVSEWKEQQIEDACAFSERWGLHPPVSNQPRYSLLWREPEKEIFPQAVLKGMGQVVFSPLAHGVLSGKYKPGQPPPPGTRGADSTQNQILMALYFKDENLRKVEEMGRIAAALGATPAQLALAWVLRNPAVSSVITGATSLEQLEENLGAAGVSLSEDVATRLTDLFPPAQTAVAAP